MKTEHAILLSRLQGLASTLGDQSLHDQEELVFDAIAVITELSNYIEAEEQYYYESLAGEDI